MREEYEERRQKRNETKENGMRRTDKMFTGPDQIYKGTCLPLASSWVQIV